MKYFISKSFKALLDYLIVLALFVIFLFVVIIAAGEGFAKWVPAYSVLVFILLFRFLYIDFKKIGAFEMKQHSGVRPHPLRGFFMGVAGMLPIALVVLILKILTAKTETATILLNYASKVLIGPMFFIVKIGNESILSYMIALAVPAVITMLAYIAGQHGFSVGGFFESKEQKARREANLKPKSPWNPSNDEKNSGQFSSRLHWLLTYKC